MPDITVACLDMAGTTVADDGSVMAAFAAAAAEFGLVPGAPGYDEAMTFVQDTMGQSKLEVFRQLLARIGNTGEDRAQHANRIFERNYAESVHNGLVSPLPGAVETITALRAAGIKVCLATGFAPVTRDALLDALGWRPLIDLALSPADAGRGRPWPDLPLTALIRLGGGAVTELAVVGDTASDVESGLRAGAGLVAAVTTGAGSRESLAAAGAPHILDSIGDLVQLIGVGSPSFASQSGVQ
jgi:phosphoglycolate phosphatase